MEIIWTEKSLSTYLNIIDYLYENWSLNEIRELESQLERLLSTLVKFQGFCPMSNLPPYRKCVLNFHISLVYFIHDNQIVLTTFLHNRSAHNY